MERFWSKVDRSAGPDGCWPWTASANHKGYGYIRVDRRLVGAHRMSFLLAGGTIPAGLMVLHDCDNRACCNPAHLRVGTAADNTADMMARGRNGCRPARGEDNHNAKLTRSDVLDMRTWRSVGFLLREIAAAYGVSVSVAHNAITGKTWAHV